MLIIKKVIFATIALFTLASTSVNAGEINTDFVAQPELNVVTVIWK